MKQAGIILTIFFALVAFVLGFGGTTVALMVFRPASDSTQTVRFVVNQGDTTGDVASNLVKDGLIRNADVFKLYARYKKLDTGIQHGVYNLKATMTMDQIIRALQTGLPDEQLVTVPPGKRVTEYPDYFSDLPKFNKDNFLTIAKTGVLPDGTKLWEKYWYVSQPHAKVYAALEGYLFPDTYYFEQSATEVDVVNTMLLTLGERLCPGPDSDPAAYALDKTECKTHPRPEGSTDIFAAMEKAYSTTDDTQALYLTLTLGSLTIREISNHADAPGVTNVYYTRYLAIHGKTTNTGEVSSMGSDPTAQYAVDSEKPPTDGKWWAELKDAGKNLAAKDPYNTDVLTNHELPPGPIAAPTLNEIDAAAAPAISKYFYFVSDKCGKILYATTLDQFSVIVGKMNTCT